MWNVKDIEWIDIESTSFCNIDCPGCFRQIKKDKVQHILNDQYLTFDQLSSWITLKNFPNLNLLNFCGSIDEPTIHPEIIQIVDHFSNICSINISSNGSTKTADFWKTLGSYGISVFFGIDGIDQQSLEKYRIGSNFKKVQKNWRAFIEAGGKATWQFIAFDHNEHLVDTARHIAQLEGFENFRLIYSHREDNQESKTQIKEEESVIVCKYANQKRVFISHTGVMLPCCFLNSEFLQDHALGHMTDFNIMRRNAGGALADSLIYNSPDEIIDGDIFKNVVKSWNKKPLKRCWMTCKKSKQDVFIDERLAC